MGNFSAKHTFEAWGKLRVKRYGSCDNVSKDGGLVNGLIWHVAADAGVGVVLVLWKLTRGLQKVLIGAKNRVGSQRTIESVCWLVVVWLKPLWLGEVFTEIACSGLTWQRWHPAVVQRQFCLFLSRLLLNCRVVGLLHLVTTVSYTQSWISIRLGSTLLLGGKAKRIQQFVDWRHIWHDYALWLDLMLCSDKRATVRICENTYFILLFWGPSSGGPRSARLRGV